MNETLEYATALSTLRFSDSRTSIAKALVAMQGDLGDVIKNAKNPHFQSKYADLAAVVDAVQPALQKAKLAFVQGSSARYMDSTALVAVETMLLHESGEWVSQELTLKPSKSDPQGVGSAITYGRRYGLQAICGVAPEDDDGNAASTPARQQQQRPQRQAASSGLAPEAIKARLKALFDDPRLTPSEVDGAIFDVTKSTEKASITSPDLAAQVVEKLEKILSASTGELPL